MLNQTQWLDVVMFVKRDFKGICYRPKMTETEGVWPKKKFVFASHRTISYSLYDMDQSSYSNHIWYVIGDSRSFSSCGNSCSVHFWPIFDFPSFLRVQYRSFQLPSKLSVARMVPQIKHPQISDFFLRTYYSLYSFKLFLKALNGILFFSF